MTQAKQKLNENKWLLFPPLVYLFINLIQPGKSTRIIISGESNHNKYY